MALGILPRRAREINKVVLLPLEEIFSNPSQPRKYFDDQSIRELAESIRENGLLQPITVRKSDPGYMLIAGERRTLAYRMLKRDQIPAIIDECTDEQSATLALVENLQRENLNYFEQAFGIDRLMKEQNMTQQQISVKLGMAQSTIANKLRLLQYSKKVQEAFLHHKLTERHARALLRLTDTQKQLEAIAYIAENALNVEQTEKYIEYICLDVTVEPKRKPRLLIVKDMRIFLNTIQKAIKTIANAGIEVNTDQHETEEYFEYQIRIPKNSIYSNPR